MIVCADQNIDFGRFWQLNKWDISKMFKLSLLFRPVNDARSFRENFNIPGCKNLRISAVDVCQHKRVKNALNLYLSVDVIDFSSDWTLKNLGLQF